MSIVITDEKAEDFAQPSQLPPLEVRMAALEQAVKFTMENIKVNITLPSPLVGVPPQVIHSNLFQIYLEQLAATRAMAERQENNNG